MLFDLPPSLVAALTGFFFGFLLSVPVGPVNLTIMNEGARRGLGYAMLIGLGAVVMEVIYCALAFTGFAALFTGKLMMRIMEIGSFIFMLYLGIRFMRERTIPTASESGGPFQKRFHPQAAFAVGFVRVMANPGVFAFWIILAAYFISRDWVQPTWSGKFSCVAGVAGGTGVWFAGLSYAASRGYGKFTDKTLLRMEHGSGICMLVLAAIHGGYMIWKLSHHRF